MLLRHEHKIDEAVKRKPTKSFEYIHARFNLETFDEFWDEWGNKQNDAVGCILYRLGELETNQKRSILKTDDHVRIINKLVKYLASIEYWHDPDNGVWEEYEEDVKGTFGDIANANKSRYGGAINGAMFVYQFAKNFPSTSSGQVPWVHIDMAPRMTSVEGEHLAKGAAGAPVRLLIKLLERY